MNNNRLKKIIIAILCLSPFLIYWLSVYFSLDNPFEEMYYSEIHTVKVMNFISLSEAVHSKSHFNPDEDDFQLLRFQTPDLLNNNELIRVFISDAHQLGFWYNRKLDNTTTLHSYFEYTFDSKTIKIEHSISINVGKDDETSYKGKQLIEELKKYGKDEQWLKKEDKRILNDVILEVWFKNGSSRYSLTHLGNLKIQEDRSLQE